ncbi:MAG: hypothetical protein ACI4O5_00530, partial [Oscillospiraceae bacterium]
MPVAFIFLNSSCGVLFLTRLLSAGFFSLFRTQVGFIWQVFFLIGFMSVLNHLIPKQKNSLSASSQKGIFYTIANCRSDGVGHELLGQLEDLEQL